MPNSPKFTSNSLRIFILLYHYYWVLSNSNESSLQNKPIIGGRERDINGNIRLNYSQLTGGKNHRLSHKNDIISVVKYNNNDSIEDIITMANHHHHHNHTITSSTLRSIKLEVYQRRHRVSASDLFWAEVIYKFYKRSTKIRRETEASNRNRTWHVGSRSSPFAIKNK